MNIFNIKLDQIQKNFIKSTFSEFFLTATIASLALLFVVHQGEMSPDVFELLQYMGPSFIVSSSLVMFAINTCLRGLKVHMQYKIEKTRDNQHKVKLRAGIKLSEDLCSFTFNILNVRLIYGIIGSLGALLLFNNANPIIGIFGDSYYDVSSGKTSLGTFFANAQIDPMAVISGLGFLTSLFFMYILPKISSGHKEKNPVVHSYVVGLAIFSTFRLLIPIIYGFISSLVTIPNNFIDLFFSENLKDAGFLDGGGLSYGGQLGIVASILFIILCQRVLRKKNVVICNRNNAQEEVSKKKNLKKQIEQKV